MCSAKSFQLFPKIAKCPPRGSISKNSNVAARDHCRATQCVIQATQQHCYFADGPSLDMAYETKCVLQSLFDFSHKVGMCPP